MHQLLHIEIKIKSSAVYRHYMETNPIGDKNHIRYYPSLYPVVIALSPEIQSKLSHTRRSFDMIWHWDCIYWLYFEFQLQMIFWDFFLHFLFNVWWFEKQTIVNNLIRSQNEMRLMKILLLRLAVRPKRRKMINLSYKLQSINAQISD